MRLDKFLVVLLCGMLPFCSKKHVPDVVETINIESATKSFSQSRLSHFSDNVEYIPLGKTSDILLRDVNLLDYLDSLILVSDLQGCFLFSYDGALIRNIGKVGRGPGEYIYIQNIKFDKNGSIFVQSTRHLLEYTKGGIFKQTHSTFTDKNIFSEGGTGQWCFVNDSLVLVQIRNDSGDEENKAAIVDLNGTPIIMYKNYIHFASVTNGISGASRIASVYPLSGVSGYKELFNDTLFHLNDSFDLNPVYRIYLGKYFASYRDFSNKFRKETDNREWIRVYDVFETNDIIMLFLQTNMNYLKRTKPVYEDGFLLDKYTVDMLGVYEKEDKKTYIVDISRTEEKLLRTGLFNDFDGGPKFFPRFRMGENRFAMPVNAYKLKQYVASNSFRNATVKYPERKKALEELANSLSEDDNPVLMVVTMR